jgi:organic radical activating enzyme
MAPSFITIEQAEQWLLTTGIMGRVSTGIQIDVNVAFRQESGAFVEHSMCDHNCTTPEHGGKGCYHCPSAFGLPENKGLKKTTMAPVEWLLERILIVAEAQRKAVQWFLEHEFESYCLRSHISNPLIKQALWRLLLRGGTEINLFGGNPEMVQRIAWLVTELKKRGFKVNMTTTGRRWLNDPAFVEEISHDLPHVLAMSLDDMTIETLRLLARMSAADIKREWRKVLVKESNYGQKQKALEAAYVLQYYREHGGYKGQPLLNMVLHAGNLEYVDEMFDVVEECLPGTILNPYPVQTAFAGEPGVYGQRELDLYEAFTDKMIAKTADPTARIVKRWPNLFLTKACFDTLRHDPDKLKDVIAGDSAWRCYNRFTGVFFTQIGRYPKPFVPFIPIDSVRGRPTPDLHPGGHLGCYWNAETVTEAARITDVDQAFRYIAYGARQLAQRAEKPCRGCRMPRLDSLHIVILENGIPDDIPELEPAYQGVRLALAGF